MSKNKKFFWLKLKEDFFENDEIKILESLPNGMAYSNFYLKLLCKSIKNNGVLTKIVETGCVSHRCQVVKPARLHVFDLSPCLIKEERSWPCCPIST